MSETAPETPGTAGPDGNVPAAAPAAEPTPTAVVDPPPTPDQIVQDVKTDVEQAATDTAAGVEQIASTDAADLHPAVAEVLQFFSVEHLREDLAAVALPFKNLAHRLAATLKGSQLTLALHNLLASKDAAVRAKLAETGSDPSAKTPGEPPAA